MRRRACWRTRSAERKRRPWVPRPRARGAGRTVSWTWEAFSCLRAFASAAPSHGSKRGRRRPRRHLLQDVLLTRLVKTALSCFWAPALLSHRLLPCVPGWALPRSWSPVSRCGEGVVRRPARRVHRPPEGGFRGTLAAAPGAASLCWRRQALQPCPPPQIAFNAYFAVFRAVSNFGDDFTVRLCVVLLTKLR